MISKNIQCLSVQAVSMLVDDIQILHVAPLVSHSSNKDTHGRLDELRTILSLAREFINGFEYVFG